MNYNKRREFIAELMGTTCFMFFGCGTNAMSVLFGLGGYTNIAIGWGLGVFLGILVSNRISGAHLNPAVTLALVMIKRFPAKKMAHYMAAQMLGGALGAALAFIFYHAKFMLVDPSLSHTADIFTTFPAVPQFFPSLLSEIMATAALLFGILAIVEHFATEQAGWMAPAAIGALIVAIGMGLGGMHGYGMNPARDLSSRIFITLAGFKNTGLLDSNIWLASPLGAMIGGPLGAILYTYTIGKHQTQFKTDPQV